MGGVAASGGTITVETRGHRFALAVDHATGLTQEIEHTRPEPARPGLTVRIAFGPDLPQDDDDDVFALRIAPTKGGLLLGQSFLHQFGSWSIDNRRGVLVLD